MMRLEVERAGPVPIYQQIKEWIYQQIVQGHWPEHYKLPAEVDLAIQLGVSRGTVRKAIADLIAEGMLVSIHGRGTFVASTSTLEQSLAQHLVTFSEELMSRGISFETTVLERGVIRPPERIASLLALSPDGTVFSVKRVRSVAQTPLILLHNYVVYDRCRGIEFVDFTRYRLFEVLEKQCGLKLDWGRRTFQAQVAGSEVQRILNLDECAPVVYLEQLVYLSDGSPIELSDVWVRGDRFRLSATVQRDELGKGSAGHRKGHDPLSS
ncbi:MAG: GntR family transcriptional regulator [Ardenticatenaceae bacterium]|nr:GntR family transcriptional regulator [Ardenticatenaceae bacterium]